MKDIIRNPFSIWLSRLIKSKILERKNHKLKIGYMSSVNCCQFGIYNTIFTNVNLNEVEMDSYTYVADNTSINKTKIGKFCSIGPHCCIGLGKHPSHTFISSHPIFFSKNKQSQISFADKNYFKEHEEISIGNDVWIGSSVIIADGVKISDGVIVAAGSVVTKDIPPYAIVGGVPAKIIKYRFNEKEVQELLKIRWWEKDINTLRNSFQLFHNIENLESIRNI